MYGQTINVVIFDFNIFNYILNAQFHPSNPNLEAEYYEFAGPEIKDATDAIETILPFLLICMLFNTLFAINILPSKFVFIIFLYYENQS